MLAGLAVKLRMEGRGATVTCAWDVTEAPAEFCAVNV
jgi:hypothetical protein